MIEGTIAGKIEGTVEGRKEGRNVRIDVAGALEKFPLEPVARPLEGVFDLVLYHKHQRAQKTKM
jgi:hypothetical protein